MSISGSGIGSGIDIRGLVEDLIEVEGSVKSGKFDADESEALAKITGFGTLKSAMFEFQSSLSNLNTLTAFQSRQAVSSDTDVFTATATNDAVPSSYSIEVTQLATNHKLTSGDFANPTSIVGTGTLRFNFGSIEHSIEINSANQTLNGIRDKINVSSADTGVQASVVTTDTGSKLVFTSLSKGSDSAFTVSVVSDSDSNDLDNAGLSQLISANLTQTTAAVDSIVLVDGATVTTSSNSLDSVIGGITIDIFETNIGAPKELTVSLDKSRARTSVEAFISSYNTVMDSINELTKYESGGFEATTGILIGDSLMRSAEYSIRRELNSAINSVTGFRTVAEIGITTNELTGKLELSSLDLAKAFNQNFDAVGELFAKDDEGIAVRMGLILDNFIDGNNGLITSRVKSLNVEIDGISEQRINLERRLQKMETRLLGQFIAMDGLVASLNQTGSFLTQQLDSLVEPLAFKK